MLAKIFGKKPFENAPSGASPVCASPKSGTPHDAFVRSRPDEEGHLPKAAPTAGAVPRPGSTAGQDTFCVTKQTQAELRALLPLLIQVPRPRGELETSIDIISNGKYFVFSLRSDPNVVFKMPRFRDDDALRARFKKTRIAQEAVKGHALHQLQVPEAILVCEKVDGKKVYLIAEERLPVDVCQHAQEELYRSNQHNLDIALQQLATFITKTGLGDIEWRNAPLLVERGEQRVRIALVDLEDMEKGGAWVGLVGGYSRGLLRCSPPQSIDNVLEAAVRAGIHTGCSRADIKRRENQVKALKKARAAEFKEDAALQHFHAIKGLQQCSGRPIPKLTPAQIGLVDETSPEGFSTQEILDAVVREANENLEERCGLIPEHLVKQRRDLLLRTSGQLHAYSMVPYTERPLCELDSMPDDIYHNSLWLTRVLKALQESGHLFAIRKHNGHGYFVQA